MSAPSNPSMSVDDVLACLGLIRIVALPEKFPRLVSEDLPEDAKADNLPTPDEDAWNLKFRLGPDGDQRL